jgi:hypothetical protein
LPCSYPNAIARARASFTAEVVDDPPISMMVSDPDPLPFLTYSFPSAVLIASSLRDKLLKEGTALAVELDFNLIVVAI